MIEYNIKLHCSSNEKATALCAYLGSYAGPITKIQKNLNINSATPRDIEFTIPLVNKKYKQHLDDFLHFIMSQYENVIVDDMIKLNTQLFDQKLRDFLLEKLTPGYDLLEISGSSNPPTDFLCFSLMLASLTTNRKVKVKEIIDYFAKYKIKISKDSLLVWFEYLFIKTDFKNINIINFNRQGDYVQTKEFYFFYRELEEGIQNFFSSETSPASSFSKGTLYPRSYSQFLCGLPIQDLACGKILLESIVNFY